MRDRSNSAPPPSETTTRLNRHPMQRPCKMLLLAMFAIAARFSPRAEDHPTHEGSNLSKAGQQYAIDAHKLLGNHLALPVLRNATSD